MSPSLLAKKRNNSNVKSNKMINKKQSKFSNKINKASTKKVNGNSNIPIKKKAKSTEKFYQEKDYSDYEVSDEEQEQEDRDEEDEDNSNSNSYINDEQSNHEETNNTSNTNLNLKEQKHNEDSIEVKISKNIIQQQETYYSIIGLRILLQDILKSSNTLPISAIYSTLNEKLRNPQLLDTLNSTISATIENFKQLIKNLLNKINKPLLKQDNKAEKSLNKETNNSNFLVKFSSKIYDNWYKQSVSNINNNSNFSFTKNIEENLEVFYETFKKKSIKNNAKIIGLSFNSSNELSNKEQYQDDEFYDLLLKDFINFNSSIDLDKIDDNNIGDAENLLNQETLIKLTGRNSNNKKPISNKHAKNKKISYQKHDKIINYMIPIENNYLFSGRDEIVKKLFGYDWNGNNIEDSKDNLKDGIIGKIFEKVKIKNGANKKDTNNSTSKISNLKSTVEDILNESIDEEEDDIRII